MLTPCLPAVEINTTIITINQLTMVYNVTWWLALSKYTMSRCLTIINAVQTTESHCKKAPKVQMPRCSSMYASLQLADAYDSTYARSR